LERGQGVRFNKLPVWQDILFFMLYNISNQIKEEVCYVGMVY